jgi:bacterioferritin
MATATPTETTKITREQLIDKLNEDLAREYQAIIAYVVYSQVLKGAEYMACSTR